MLVTGPRQVTRIIEEEWSYIPVGGPLPLGSQTATAFGAAANLVHPATGYSIARSMREAPGLARDVAAVLRRRLPVRATAAAVWDSLWPAEKRRQVRRLSLKLLCDINFFARRSGGSMIVSRGCTACGGASMLKC